MPPAPRSTPGPTVKVTRTELVTEERPLDRSYCLEQAAAVLRGDAPSTILTPVPIDAAAGPNGQSGYYGPNPRPDTKATFDAWLELAVELA